MKLLNSKTVLISGGSLGIGFEIAKKCAEEGANIIITARNLNNLEKALKGIKEISAAKHNYYSLDVSKYEEVERFRNWCKNNYGDINCLVNCAGIYGPIGKLTEIDMGKFTEAISINFLGTVYMCNLIAPIIKSNGKKKIINFSGGGAASPFPYYSAYATSKIAIVRFTENIAAELAQDNFDINCVAPGFVITRLHQQTIEAGPESAGYDFYENTKKQIEKGGIPAEMAANLTVFLASDKSDGITGKFISAPWDKWQDTEFQELLRTDKDFATLRRIDNKTFYKKT